MTRIRPAAAEDVEPIAALIDAAYSHYIPVIGVTPRPMLDDHAARVARGEHYVLEAEGTLLAVLTLEAGKRSDALHIFNIAVAPAAQGQGLLRHLLGFAEDVARQRGLARLTLYTNVLMTRNRAIYAHLGFVEVAQEEGGGYTIVFMQRPVPTA